MVTVSLVTKDIPYRPHPHCLVGKDCADGICVIHINPHSARRHRYLSVNVNVLSGSMVSRTWSESKNVISCLSMLVFSSFANLGIQCVRRKELDASLQKRRNKNIDPFNSELLNIADWMAVFWNLVSNLHKILIILSRCSRACASVECFCLVLHQRATLRALRTWTMNVVRLCFQCEVERKDGDRIPLAPVISNPIYDKSKSKMHVGPKTYSAQACKLCEMMFGLFLFVWLEATTTAELKVNRLNVVRGPCTGKTEIYMLCDKVQKGKWTLNMSY